MPKSHVGMGYSICPVCGTKHDEVVLLDRQLKNTLECDNFMGWAMCPEHEKLRQEGYIALIEVKNQPSGLADADRTGNIAHVRDSAWQKLFNTPIPPKGITFIEVGVLEQIKQRTQP